MDDQTISKIGGDEKLVKRWEPVLEGVEDPYTRRVTAQLLDNQAKVILHERAKRLDEAAVGTGTTTVGDLSTFQKFAFPLVRRVFPELIFNKIGGMVQPMGGPVSQVFYLGSSRYHGSNAETIYSKYNLTYKGGVANPIGSASAGDGVFHSGGLNGSGVDRPFLDSNGFDVSNVLRAQDGSPSATYGGDIASWPDPTTTLGWSVSAGERLTGTGIPEMSFHIENQTVTARTRKMRALWTIEAAQDLKAYHSLDLERELTDLLSKELQLEIDRELIEDIRMIAYGFNGTGSNGIAGWQPGTLDNATGNSMPNTYGKDPSGNDGFTPGAYQYDFHTNPLAANTSGSNVFVIDLNDVILGTNNFAPQHTGHVYSNLLSVLNFASQDIYRTTFRGPGTVLVTSPLIASMLESASKLEGGLPQNMGPSNTIEYRGRFAGKYELIVDPMFPQDEILMAYKGSGPMDGGFCYCPYIPLQQIPTITDPESFQPRKGILTRYGKLAVTPASRFYRIIRLVGADSNFLLKPHYKNSSIFGTSASGY
jgi:hypothetical protein